MLIMEFSGWDLTQGLWVYEKWGVTCSGTAASPSFTGPVGLTTRCPPASRRRPRRVHPSSPRVMWPEVLSQRRMSSVFLLTLVLPALRGYFCQPEWLVTRLETDLRLFMWRMSPCQQESAWKAFCAARFFFFFLTFTATSSSYRLTNRNILEMSFQI